MSDRKNPALAPTRYLALALTLFVAAACGSGADERPVAGSSPDGRPVASSSEGDQPVALVYKSPTCGCCSLWVEHLEANGFEVKTEDVLDLAAVKAEHGITARLQSCHTAVIEGYVVEGHVPAEVIMRMLDEQPEIAGLSVPGMPMGSPGMEGARSDPYDVLAFDNQGTVEVYSSH